MTAESREERERRCNATTRIEGFLHKCDLPEHEKAIRHRCGEEVSGNHIPTQKCGLRWADIL